MSYAKAISDPTPEGQNILILYRWEQNFKMITSAKHEGYISVEALVRSTRVQTLIVVNEERFKCCQCYKNQRDISFKLLCTLDHFESLSLPVQN